MRQAVLVRPGEIRIESVEVPDTGDEEILLRVGAALTCGTDLKTYRRGHPLIPLPAPMGHEFAGEVAKVGRKVEGVEEGTRIVAAPSAPCSACFYCARGEWNLCETLPERLVLGGFAEYVRLPSPVVRTNTFVLPDDIPFDHAALLEPLACVVHGQRRLGISRRETIAIIGSGPIAILHLQLALLGGAGEVMVIGAGEMRLKVARDLGAKDVIDRREEDPEEAVRHLTRGYGPDAVIECAGDPEAWALATRMVRKGGRCLLFGGCQGGAEVTFEAAKIHYGEVTLMGAFHFTPRDARESLELLVSKEIDSKPLITDRIPLEELEAGLKRMMDRDCLKLSVQPGDAPAGEGD